LVESVKLEVKVFPKRLVAIIVNGRVYTAFGALFNPNKVFQLVVVLSFNVTVPNILLF
jgi:hypothetical protein